MTENELRAEIERLSLDLHEARETIARREAVIRIVEEDVDALRKERDALREALKFYADGEHFIRLDDSAWDTTSGEPQNFYFYFDEAGTATIEDGSIARAALAQEQEPT